MSTVVSHDSKAGFAECSYQTRHALNMFAIAWVTAVIPPVWLASAGLSPVTRSDIFAGNQSRGKNYLLPLIRHVVTSSSWSLEKFAQWCVTTHQRNLMLHASTGSSCAGIGTWKSSDTVNVLEVLHTFWLCGHQLELPLLSMLSGNSYRRE